MDVWPAFPLTSLWIIWPYYQARQSEKALVQMQVSFPIGGVDTAAALATIRSWMDLRHVCESSLWHSISRIAKITFVPISLIQCTVHFTPKRWLLSSVLCPASKYLPLGFHFKGAIEGLVTFIDTPQTPCLIYSFFQSNRFLTPHDSPNSLIVRQRSGYVMKQMCHSMVGAPVSHF